MVKIFRAYLVTGYVPGIWSLVKVVFIPKPSRNSYSGPRDFRPISLMSFLLKTMDRLVNRILRDEILAPKPLHPNQHAYQAGSLWKRLFISSWFGLRRLLTSKRYPLAYSLTEKGRLITPPMTPCLQKHGGDYTIVRWIRANLEGQLATATLGGHSRSIGISRGCPQEGVLSPLLWCLVVNELLARLNEGGVYTQGLADDICLLAVGKFPNTVSGLIQWNLHTLEVWCDELGPLVNTDKTGLLAFTRKRKLPGSFEPR
jgi:hypothetical protein